MSFLCLLQHKSNTKMFATFSVFLVSPELLDISPIPGASVPRKPVTLHSAMDISEVEHNTTLIGTENHPQHPRRLSTSTVPKFTYRHWRHVLPQEAEKYSLLLAYLFFLTHPRHIFHTLVYESKLTAARLLFELWKKWLWIEHAAFWLLGALRLQSFIWVVHFKREREKKNIWSKEGGDTIYIYIYTNNSKKDNLRK